MLRGFENFNESGLTEVLSDNLIYYLDYGFLEKGGYSNSETPSSSSKLINFNDPRQPEGKIWGSRRKNWVWEKNYGIDISGVWIDGDLTTSGYQISYRNGFVIFDEPISTSSNVEVNHSNKYIYVFDADQVGIFNADKDSFNVTDGNYINGSRFSLPDKTIQLPAIGIEILNSKVATPFELGSLSQNIKTRGLCNILSTDPKVAQRTGDYLMYQKHKEFIAFDRDLAAISGYYPVNFDGTINNRDGDFPFLSENFPYSKIFAKNVYISDLKLESLNKINSDLFHLTARIELECVF